jgi:hypothetical protein
MEGPVADIAGLPERLDRTIDLSSPATTATLADSNWRARLLASELRSVGAFKAGLRANGTEENICIAQAVDVQEGFTR